MEFWTDERKERCRAMWESGSTATEIGRELGATRSSVLAKIHRSGWIGPNSKSNSPYPRPASSKLRPRQNNFRRDVRPKRAPPPSGPRPDGQPIIVAVEQSYRAEGLVKFGDLTSDMCRWPLGDPRSGEFGFCGARSFASLVYCAAHATAAYETVTQRRQRLKEEKEARDAKENENEA